MVEGERKETGEWANGIDNDEEGGMRDPFRNDDAGVPLADIHSMDGEVLGELGELGLCGTAEGEREEWGGEGMTPPPPPPRGKSMKDDQRMAQEAQPSMGIPHLECGSKKIQ